MSNDLRTKESKMLPKDRLDKFLNALAALCRDYNVSLESCGCCWSIWATYEEENKEYTYGEIKVSAKGELSFHKELDERIKDGEAEHTTHN